MARTFIMFPGLRIPTVQNFSKQQYPIEPLRPAFSKKPTDSPCPRAARCLAPSAAHRYGSPGDQYLSMPVLVVQRSTSAETGNIGIVAVVLTRSPGVVDVPAPAASTPRTVNIMSCRSSNASGKDFRKTKQRTTCYVFIGIHRSAQGFRHRQLLGFITGNDPVLSLAFSLVLVHSGLSGSW